MRMHTTTLWVDEKYQAEFQANDLGSFQKLYNCSIGSLVRGGKKKTIKRFSLCKEGGQEGFYVKKRRISLKDHVKSALQRRKPASCQTRHEVKLLQLYKSLGAPVVETVAWGEQRWLGIPLRGVLVLQEVEGEDFVDKIKSGNRFERMRLIKAYGRFVGSLHSKGLISSKARVTDVICVSANSREWREFQYTLIDREKGPLEIEAFDLDKISKVLSDILVRFVLYTGVPETKEIAGFLQAYVEGAGFSPDIGWKQLYLSSERFFYQDMNNYDEQI